MNQKKVIMDQYHGGKRWRENICRDTCPSVHNDIACAVLLGQQQIKLTV